MYEELNIFQSNWTIGQRIQRLARVQNRPEIVTETSSRLRGDRIYTCSHVRFIGFFPR